MATVSTYAVDAPRDGGAVSWGAVFAGAAGAAALSLVLFLLGTGLGLAVVSPWGDEDVSGTTATMSTILWVTFVQLAASALGGYLAGRLRSRWVTIHTNEVYFRDTVHGFLAWAVSTLLMATLLSSAVGAMVSAGVKAGGAVAGAAVTAAGAGAATAATAAQDESAGADPFGYFVDSLFRAAPSNVASASPPSAPDTSQSTPDRSQEVARIFANALASGELATADREYLNQLVAERTGMPPADAERRVRETYTQLQARVQQTAEQAKKVADDARKASAWLALWLVVSLFVGAFVASFAATFGGRLRDSSALAKT